MMEMPLGFRVSGLFRMNSPIKSNIPACAGIFMRTDYYVVSPNSRAYTRGRRASLGKACAHGPDGQ